MKWLVLGALGFIGQAVVQALEGEDVVGVDLCDARRPFDIHHSPNLGALLGAVRPHVVVNAVRTEDAHQTMQAVLEAVRKVVPRARVLRLCSAAVYGGGAAGQLFRESDALAPSSQYGLQMQSACQLAAASGLDVVSARAFNVIGPHQGDYLFLANLFRRVRSEQAPVTVEHAQCVRDWIDVRDVASAVRLLGLLPAPPRVVNVCSGRGRTVASVARAAARVSGVEVRPRRSQDAPLRYSVGDPTLLKSLGWTPRYRLERSLSDQWNACL
jgi:nucleoside-diphosphate-sugar epimerase